MPGPFQDPRPLRFCLEGRRLDAPASPGVDPAVGLSGLCVSAAQEPSSCSEDGHCFAGQRCVCGLCRVPLCYTNDDCPSGQECSGAGHRCQSMCLTDADCPAGQSCDPSSLGCARRCDSDAQCLFGSVCSSTRRLCVTVPCQEEGCSAGRRCDLQRQVAVLASPSVVEGPEGLALWAHVQETGIVRFVSDPQPSYRADPQEPVLEADLTDPEVRRGPEGLFLVAGREDGSALAAFTSPDGIRWSPLAGTGNVLVASEGWEDGWVGRPSALWTSAGWLLAYEGGPGAGVGLAHLDPDGTASRVGDGPVIDVDSAGTDPWWTEVDRVGSPALIWSGCTGQGRTPAVIFQGRGVEWMGVDVGGDAQQASASLGHAHLTETLQALVDPRNPFYSTTAGIAVARGEHDPFALCIGGQWSLYFTASNVESGGEEGAFLALSF